MSLWKYHWFIIQFNIVYFIWNFPNKSYLILPREIRRILKLQNIGTKKLCRAFVSVLFFIWVFLLLFKTLNYSLIISPENNVTKTFAGIYCYKNLSGKINLLKCNKLTLSKSQINLVSFALSTGKILTTCTNTLERQNQPRFLWTLPAAIIATIWHFLNEKR